MSHSSFIRLTSVWQLIYSSSRDFVHHQNPLGFPDASLRLGSCVLAYRTSCSHTDSRFQSVAGPAPLRPEAVGRWLSLAKQLHLLRHVHSDEHSLAALWIRLTWHVIMTQKSPSTTGPPRPATLLRCRILLLKCSCLSPVTH